MNLRDLVSDTYTPTRYNFYEIKVKNGFFCERNEPRHLPAKILDQNSI